MPAILIAESYDRWLGIEPDPRELLISFPAEPMRMWLNLSGRDHAEE